MKTPNSPQGPKKGPESPRKEPASAARRDAKPAAAKSASAKSGPKPANKSNAKPAAKAPVKAKAPAKQPAVKQPVYRNEIEQTAALAGGDLGHAIYGWLDEAKAEAVTVLDIRGKTSIGDCMFIASGRSDRHVGAIADQLERQLKSHGVTNARIEGKETCDWVLVDVGAIIVHLFRPDVREFYNLEKMWSAERPGEPRDDTAH